MLKLSDLPAGAFSSRNTSRRCVRTVESSDGKLPASFKIDEKKDLSFSAAKLKTFAGRTEGLWLNCWNETSWSLLEGLLRGDFISAYPGNKPSVSGRQRIFMTLCVSFHLSRANETAIACLGRNRTRSLLMLLSIIKTSGSCLASVQVAQMVSYAHDTVFTNLWWAAVIDYWTHHRGAQ